MRRLLIFALVLLPALPALAAGRTLALNTLIKNDPTQLRTGESKVTVRAPKNIKLSRWTGDQARTFLPLQGRLNTAGDKRLFTVDKGVYYVSPSSAGFTITK